MTPPPILRFPTLDSTNRYAREHLTSLADGTVVQADAQTAGRGRLNRSWISHIPGNLYLSLVVKPRANTFSPASLIGLSQLLALAVAQTLEHHAPCVRLKWPNDIMAGHDRKIAGILAESVVSGASFQGLILGLGLNVNLDAPTLATIDQPATALNLLTGQAQDPNPLRDQILAAFSRQREPFLQQGFSLIRDDYLRRLWRRDQAVQIRTPREPVHGILRSLSPNGAAELEQSDGSIRAVDLGELFAAS